MLSTHKFATAAVALGIMAFGASSAWADTVEYGVSAPVINPNGDLLSSNGGLSPDGFTVVTDDDGTGDSVALRARSFDNGNTIVHNGSGHYSVNPGFTGSRPNFYIEYQFTPGIFGGDYSAYTIQVDITSDTGYSSTGTGNAAYWTGTDGYLDYGQYGSPRKNTFNNTWIYADGSTVDYGDGEAPAFVIVNSWQLPWFGAIPGSTTTGTYNPDAPGNYDVTFTVFNGDTEVLSNAINVTVVPTPSAALAGFGLMGITALRRRRSL
jgi:MYXO-CTERM domain-containing protein